MAGLGDLIAAQAPDGARVLVIAAGADEAAAVASNGTTAVPLADAAAGAPLGDGFDVVIAHGVFGLADDPAAVLERARAALREGGALLVAEPDAQQALREPELLAADRRRRFTAGTLDAALAAAGFVVSAWPSRGEGLLVARAVAGDDAALVHDLRGQIAALETRAGAAERLEQERAALDARVHALETRERDLRERLLATHELLADRDADVVRLVESDRELRGVQGTVVFRAGWRYWRAKALARKVAGRLRRQLAG